LSFTYADIEEAYNKYWNLIKKLDNYFNASLTALATAKANLIGTAFPIWLYTLLCEPRNL